MILTQCIALMDKAKTVLSYALTETELETVRTAYNNDPIVVFIDIDYACSFQFNGVRNELIEAATLFRKAGGEVHALTSSLTMYNSTLPIENGIIFNSVLYEPDLDVNKKAKHITNDTFIRVGFRKYVFGNKELFEKLQPEVGLGDLVLNVEKTELLELYELYDYNNPLQNYTPIEYILFYLTMKLNLNSFDI